MKKNYNCALGIITLGLLEWLYFMWLPSPKCMFRSLGQPWAYQDIITGVICALLVSFIFIMSVKSIKRPGEKFRLFSLKSIGVIAALFAAQLLHDWVQLLTEKRFPNGAFAVDYVLILAVWLAFALILMAITGHGDWKAWKTWLPLAAVGLILAVFVLLDLRDAGIREEILARYKPTAELPQNRLMNMRFAHEMRCIGLDFACGAAYLIRVALNTATDPEEEKDRGRKGRLALRAYCLLTVAFFLYLGKAALLPSSAIQLGYIWHNTQILDFGDLTDTFTASKSDSLKIVRGDISRDDWYIDEMPIYLKSKRTMSYNDKKVCSFKVDDLDTCVGLLIISGRDGAIIENSKCEKAVVCREGVIAWLENGKFRHIQIKDLPHTKQNDTLTAICVEMLARGDLRFYDFGLDYMMKSKPELMAWYTERYAAGDFTEQEKAGDYNTEYIQRRAVNALGEMEQTSS